MTSVKSTAYNKLKVSWKVVPAATSYQIYRSTAKDGDYQNIKTINSVGTSSWTDGSVKTGKHTIIRSRRLLRHRMENRPVDFRM